MKEDVGRLFCAKSYEEYLEHAHLVDKMILISKVGKKIKNSNIYINSKFDKSELKSAIFGEKGNQFMSDFANVIFEKEDMDDYLTGLIFAYEDSDENSWNK